MTTLQMQAREVSTQGAMSKLRAENLVPGIIYGAKEEPRAVTVSARDIQVAIQEGGFFTSLQIVSIDGKEEKVLPSTIQYHPVSGKFMHIDFQRFDPKRKVKVEVTLRVVDEDVSPGVKIGGIVQVTRPTIEVLCRADNIPSEFVVSVGELNIGDSVKVSAIDMPDGVETVIQDRDFTLASIISTRSSNKADEELDAELAAEAAEGEEGAEAKEASAEGGEGDAEVKEEKSE
jgi:large subunit ribosomal protein L25